jgi:hypothetical protein
VQKINQQGVECKKGRRLDMARLNLLPQDLEQSKELITEAIKIAESCSHSSE